MSFLSTLRNAGKAFNFGKSVLNSYEQSTRAPGYQAPKLSSILTNSVGALTPFGPAINAFSSGAFSPKPSTNTGGMSVAPKVPPAPGAATPVRSSGVAPGPMSVAPTPSSINTAISPYSSGSASAGSSTPNPYADYLAQEQSLIQSGNKKQAIQDSQSLNGSTPPPPTAPTPPTTLSSLSDPAFLKKVAQDNLAKLQQQYLSTLTPSEQEKTLQSQLTDYLGNAKLGISNIEGQGRGIPLALVRGQQSKLQEQANIGAQTLEGQLANEQANRQAQSQVYGTQLGYEQQNQQNDQTQAAQQQDFQVKMLAAGYNPVDPSTVTDPNSVIQIGGQTFLKPSPESKVHEVGGNLVDETGKVIYQGSDTTAAGDSYTLSPGQVRYDAKGNVIAQAPGGATANITDAQRKVYGFYTRAQDAENNVQAALPNVADLAQGALPNFLQGPNYQQYKQAADAWIKAVLRQESGAAIPPDEINSYMKTYFPQVGDSQATIQQKAESRQAAMASLQQEAAGAAGASGGGITDVDKFLDSFSSGLSTPSKGSIVNVSLGNEKIPVSTGIAQQLAMADRDYFAATGQHIQVSEGLRSTERQAELYQKYKSGQGGRAAPPGQSFHETGNAVDISGDWQAAAPYLQKYGFKNELPDDRHHFSIGEFA